MPCKSADAVQQPVRPAHQETAPDFRELLLKGRRTFQIEDTQRYRDGYPGLRDDPAASQNLEFYSNKVPSRPDGDFIDRIHKEWWGDHAKLEAHHGYIQWLFPIREKGLNDQAQPLQPHEADAIRSVPELRERFLRSYELMLDFYGMQLRSRDTGEVGRSEAFATRYASWARQKLDHNYLRITRILKCLGEVGFEHFKVPFLRHVLREVYGGALQHCYTACTEYWIGTLRVTGDQEKIAAFELDLAEQAWKRPGALPAFISLPGVGRPQKQAENVECGCVIA